MEYKIENLWLTNNVKTVRATKPYSNRKQWLDWSWEHEFSDKEKVEFANKYSELARYAPRVVDLICTILESYKRDVENGTIKTRKNPWDPGSTIPNVISLRSWVKKHGWDHYIDTSNIIGRVYNIPVDNLRLGNNGTVPNSKYGYRNKYSEEKGLINQIFYNILEKLYYLEKEYFVKVDPLSINLKKIAEYERRYTNLDIDVISDAVANGNERAGITLEESESILAAYVEIEDHIKELKDKLLEKHPGLNAGYNGMGV